MKRFLFTSLLSITVLLVSAAPSWDGTIDTDWAGDGSSSTPYLISTAEELAGLASRTNAGETFEGKYFRLTSDISLSNPSAAAEERPLWVPIGAYSLENNDDEENGDPGDFYGTER